MPFVSRGRLCDYLCGKTQFDEREAAFFIRQLLDAIHYLHNCYIAHLDIKPENLLVDVDPASSTPQLKLIDFGDARHIYDNTYVHRLMGSAEFAAPELVSCRPCSLLSDIWSVGVVVYVILSGVSPFLDESLDETCSNIVRRDFCFPDEYFSGVSGDAKDFISMLLVFDVASRPVARVAMDHAWIRKNCAQRSATSPVRNISVTRLVDFVERRRHQNDINVVRYTC
jgi:serine/threonine protein kinase